MIFILKLLVAMRPYSLLLPLVLLAGAARAQTAPSITAADMPVAGDSLRLLSVGRLDPENG